MTQIIPCEIANALKAAFKMLVRRNGGVDAMAACTQHAKSSVSDYGNFDMDRFAPIHVVLAAELFAGEPMVTAAMARAQGYKLVALTSQEAAGVGDTLERVASTSSSLLTATVRALADGVICERENAELDRGLDELERAARAARSSLAAVRAPQLRAVG